MRGAPLVLSHWDAVTPVCISAKTAKDLRNYQIMGVRFLYDSFQKGQKGTILNHEPGMNFQIQISAFLNAMHSFITPHSPVLIICPEESLNVWKYHLSNHAGYQATSLTVESCQEILEGHTHQVIISTANETKLLREMKALNLFCVIVEDLDSVVMKSAVKYLKSPFNVGLTNRNFMQNRDQKLFWNILSWSNFKTGKLEEFCTEDNDHLDHLRWPYNSWWQRLTWQYCDSFKPPTATEQKQLDADIRKQPNQYNRETRRTGKRKTTSKRKHNQDKERKASTTDTKNILNCGQSKKTKIHSDPSQNFNDSQETIIGYNDDLANLNDFSNFVTHQNLDNFENENPEKIKIKAGQNSNDSQDTIIDDEDVPLAYLNNLENVKQNFESEENDDNPILSSIIAGRLSPVNSKVNFKKETKLSSESYSELFDESFQKNLKEEAQEDNILTSIIKNNSSKHQNNTETSNVSNSSFHKKEILSLINEDD